MGYLPYCTWLKYTIKKIKNVITNVAKINKAQVYTGKVIVHLSESFNGHFFMDCSHTQNGTRTFVSVVRWAVI